LQKPGLKQSPALALDVALVGPAQETGKQWKIMIKSWKHCLNSSAIYIRSGGDEWKHMLLIHSETTPFNFAATMLEHLRHWQSLSPTPMVTW